MSQSPDSLFLMECLRCGTCCQRHQPQLSPAELKSIAGKLGISADDFISRYVQLTLVGYLLRQTGEGCVFLTRKKGMAACSIYACRPRACREWVPSLSRPECQAGMASRSGV